jgi:hypothetical protein
MTKVDQARKHITEKIGNSYASDRKELARFIINVDIALPDILDILFMDHPVSTRFSWMLSDLVEEEDRLAPVLLEYAFYHRERIKALNFERVIAKQAYLCGAAIPEDLEGELLDWLLHLYSKSKIQPSIRHYVKKNLANLVKKYPELQNEIDLITEQTKNHQNR